jgi:hypothetical protein
VLPPDNNIILTFHYYSPFQFTHQGASWVDGSDAWLGTTWEGTYIEKLAMKNDMAAVAGWADINDIPVWVGEFGSFSLADMDSRAKWTETAARFFESFNFSWCYWEYKSGFGVWDQESASWNTPLTDALFSTDESVTELNPEELGPNLITNGDFKNGLTGWRKNVSAGAAADAAVDGEILAVDITDPGTEQWHVQITNDLPLLTAGSSYSVLFDIWSDAPRAISAAIQHQSDPWNILGFSSYSVGTEPVTQVLNFSISEDEDQAGLTFNIGLDTTGVYIDNVILVKNN